LCRHSGHHTITIVQFSYSSSPLEGEDRGEGEKVYRGGKTEMGVKSRRDDPKFSGIGITKTTGLRVWARSDKWSDWIPGLCPERR
jgi:hypothetical protein